MNEEIHSCFRLLEVEPSASPEMVRQAFRQMLKVWHPDRFAGDLELERRANEKVKQINKAYELIRRFQEQSHDSHKPNQGTDKHANRRENPPSDPSCDVILSFANVEEPKAYDRWSSTAEYSESVVAIADRFCVTMSVYPAIRHTDGSELRGFVHTTQRKVFISTQAATVFTPVFLIACQLIRDILKFSGHAHLRQACLHALRKKGFLGEPELFSTKSYRRAEGELARASASFAVSSIRKEKSGIASWFKATKARYASALLTEPSFDDVSTYISSLLLYQAPYYTRIEFVKDFQR